MNVTFVGGGNMATALIGGLVAGVEGALGVARIGYKIDGRVTWRQVFNASAPVLPGFAAHRAFAL